MKLPWTTFSNHRNIYCYGSRPIIVLIALITDVGRILAAIRAVDRLEAEIVHFPSLDRRNPPRNRTACQCACINDLLRLACFFLYLRRLPLPTLLIAHGGASRGDHQHTAISTYGLVIQIDTDDGIRP